MTVDEANFAERLALEWLERIAQRTQASGADAAQAQFALDLAGVAVSSGSACSSGKVAPSHVLAAMGVRPDFTRGAIRLSLGWASTAAEVERFAAAFASIIARMRASRRESSARNAEGALARE